MLVFIHRLTSLVFQAIGRWPKQAALIILALFVLGAVNAFVAGKFDPQRGTRIGDSCGEGRFAGHIGVSALDGKTVCIVEANPTPRIGCVFLEDDYAVKPCPPGVPNGSTVVYISNGQVFYRTPKP